MDSLQLGLTWLATAAPGFPSSALQRWALPLFWAVVLAFLAAHGFARRSQTTRRLAMVMAAAWAFAPGSWSPAWWFGLAFQLPSWTSVLVCGWFGIGHWRRAGAPQASRYQIGFFHWLALPLGAVLLMDMFVLLPFALHRWGFSALAVVVFLAAAALAWAAARGESQRREASLVLSALALFVLTRLPTGNVFDAVLDPWLWLALVVTAVRHGLNALRSRF